MTLEQAITNCLAAMNATPEEIAQSLAETAAEHGAHVLAAEVSDSDFQRQYASLGVYRSMSHQEMLTRIRQIDRDLSKVNQSN